MTDVEAVLPAAAVSAAAAEKNNPAGRRFFALSRAAKAAAISIVVFPAAWWAVSHAGVVPKLFLPTPEAVAAQAVHVWREGFVDATLAEHLWASLQRVLIALVLAAAAGIPIGVAMGLSPSTRGALEPFIEFYRPIPPLAYLPLIVIWFGIGETSKILLIALAIFAPVVVSAAAGVRGVDRDRINAARSLGATPFQAALFVALPGALPDILTGLRIGLAAGWSTLVAAELIAATRGLGFMVQSAAQFLVTDVVVLGIFVVAAVAFAMEALLRLAQRTLTPWRGRF